MQRLLLLQPPRQPLRSSSIERGLSTQQRQRRRPRGMRRLELVLGKPGSGKTALVRVWLVCEYMHAIRWVT